MAAVASCDAVFGHGAIAARREGQPCARAQGSGHYDRRAVRAPSREQLGCHAVPNPSSLKAIAKVNSLAKRLSAVCGGLSGGLASSEEAAQLRTPPRVAHIAAALPAGASSLPDAEICAAGAPVEEDDNPIAAYMQQVRAAAGGGGPRPAGSSEMDFMREECGVVGIFGDPEAGRLSYLALHALQHRGQEGAGIATCQDGRLQLATGMGLVADVFDRTKLAELQGTSAIGHVRYATAGGSLLKNVQPFVAAYRFGAVAVAHNGNLTNHMQLRHMLEDQGSIFNTSSDTEVVLHLIAMSPVRPFIARLVDACEQLQGAYSLVFLTEDKVVAVRDPHGFRPLVLGRRANGAVVVASETCALDLIEAAYEREVHPGEVVVVDREGETSMCLMPQRQRKACIFEHIYFALPNSVVFGRSVYESRYEFGRILAKESPADCDVVIAVPDSGVVAALGFAAEAGRPFQQGLIRSHYVGRTFIEPSQKIRDFSVRLKLAPVQSVLKGKRVVVVDDSIVRGTTSSKIVRLIKEAGAAEVHMRIASPPITGSCYYGVDTPSSEELISFRLSIEETRAFIGADSLAFLPLGSLHGMLGESAPTFCDACFSGAYPVPPHGGHAAPSSTLRPLLTGGRLLEEDLNAPKASADSPGLEPHAQSNGAPTSKEEATPLAL